MIEVKCFDIKPLIAYCEQLLCADETLMALNLLDMVPGYYRDHYPKELLNLRREIMAKIATASFYATDRGCELNSTDEGSEAYINTLRAQLIVMDVKALNKAGRKPVVHDYAPGENWLAIVLEKQGLDFWYNPIYVNHPSNEKFKYRYEKYLPDNSPVLLDWLQAPAIFSACEVVEHLHRPEEIRFDMERYIGKADVIHVSTPKYTFNPNVTDWRSIGDLGHLRTWTPKEFFSFVGKTFPEYQIANYDSQILHARCINPDSKYDCIKMHYDVKGS